MRRCDNCGGDTCPKCINLIAVGMGGEFASCKAPDCDPPRKAKPKPRDVGLSRPLGDVTTGGER